MNLTCHHLETIRQEKTTRETSEAVDRRPGQILECHDLAEDNKTGQPGGGMLRPLANDGKLQLPRDDDEDDVSIKKSF